MSLEPVSPSKRRSSWRALLVGAVVLFCLWLTSFLVEPVLISFALGPQQMGPRSGASGWANSNVWLVSVGFSCLVLLAGGYISMRLSSSRSWSVPITLLVLLIIYVVFAQFPATRSALRIGLWSFGLPVSFAFGAWLASLVQNAAELKSAVHVEG